MKCLVRVARHDGTLALCSNQMFEHKHMCLDSMGVTLSHSTDETWFVKVLFPPGIVYDVVREHLEFLSDEVES